MLNGSVLFLKSILGFVYLSTVNMQKSCWAKSDKVGIWTNPVPCFQQKPNKCHKSIPSVYPNSSVATPKNTLL